MKVKSVLVASEICYLDQAKWGLSSEKPIFVGFPNIERSCTMTITEFTLLATVHIQILIRSLIPLIPSGRRLFLLELPSLVLVINQETTIIGLMVSIVPTFHPCACAQKVGKLHVLVAYA